LEFRRVLFRSNLVIKTNWSGDFDNVDICALEARCYHFLTEKLIVPTAKCYYADWDDNGSGEGIIVLEDLSDRGGRFGTSMDVNTLRSEEHTSELQSREKLVCRLLLE